MTSYLAVSGRHSKIRCHNQYTTSIPLQRLEISLKLHSSGTCYNAEPARSHNATLIPRLTSREVSSTRKFISVTTAKKRNNAKSDIIKVVLCLTILAYIYDYRGFCRGAPNLILTKRFMNWTRAVKRNTILALSATHDNILYIAVRT